MKYLSLFGLVFGFQFGYALEMHTPDISIFDSRTMPGESYLIMDDCFVPLKTTSDLCYVQKQIKKECGITYELEKNCEKK
jgi:hypothetical protein